ncbi:MAG: hypothetical protein KA533_07165 [Sphingobium sp.]|nr:hypothetical protein [Sphingobium sp.]MBP6111757.1 hypothetical protein [Sphingobium sp.]MBP8671304.1 hypothetical protein [Sphingobium sp.]MBP9158345.1 hypothetical protein [Sphingobium sp.]
MHEYDEEMQELVLMNEENTRKLMAAAAEITAREDQQVLAMLTAATTLIEKSVGPRRAAPVLIAFLQPTFSDWENASGATVQ